MGYPYHISALFSVDLGAFRKRGIGDIYRDTYHQLTADPHSLSNLDQDLPNYLQRGGVPIQSLPEEWLWCETWCGNSSKARAKTIDLCNNPLTKEPKLDQVSQSVSQSVSNPNNPLTNEPKSEQARRIGGERWAEIDGELTQALSY